jgi:hypothetical protein
MYDFSEGRDIHEEWRRARLEELERLAAEEAAEREKRLRERLSAPSDSYANRCSRRDPALVLSIYAGQFPPLPR